jgi:hypothetical protein
MGTVVRNNKPKPQAHVIDALITGRIINAEIRQPKSEKGTETSITPSILHEDIFC